MDSDNVVAHRKVFLIAAMTDHGCIYTFPNIFNAIMALKYQHCKYVFHSS